MQRESRSRIDSAHPWWSHSALLRLRVLLLAGVLIVLGVVPSELLTSAPPVCLFKNLFDTPCAGCGMVRALSALLNGDLAGACAYNPGALIVGPLMLAVLIIDLLRLVRHSKDPTLSS
ncbi:MAG TPA: DUF2752 domain-containing protein [Bacteroidota bacterium]|nr:DUF2752 domain-containing protein [Bacteroidota bacterium]